VVTRGPDGIEEHQIGAGSVVEVPTRLRGWYSWSGGSKTQYAANPKYGGAENFLRAHASIFRAVDECERLGMTTHIRDDAKYWRHRDKSKLLAELAKWDELIAGFAGRLGDALDDAGVPVVAPIKDRPDYEHLEAKGDARFKRAAGRRDRGA
jgi:hypothetical protein